MFSKMQPLRCLTLGALLVIPTITSPTQQRVVHEKRDKTNFAWTKSSRVPQDQILPLRIALTQSNLEKGHDWLMDVSHPSSPNYGKHWTFAEVKNAFKPRWMELNTHNCVLLTMPTQ